MPPLSHHQISGPVGNPMGQVTWHQGLNLTQGLQAEHPQSSGLTILKLLVEHLIRAL